MEPIRLATPEEITEIAATSELTLQSTVFSFKDARAVLRQALELDPVYYGTLNMRDKMALIWGLENIMRANGAPLYYFNVPADMTEYRAVVEKLGAEPTSPVPEIRYKKRL